MRLFRLLQLHLIEIYSVKYEPISKTWITRQIGGVTMNILVADKLPEKALDDLRVFDPALNYNPDLKDEPLLVAIKEHHPEILIVRSTKVNAGHLEGSPVLSLVIRGGAGVNTIDVDKASELGVFVANCPGKNSVAVAELAFAHILSMDRHVVACSKDLEQGIWNKKKYSKAKGILGKTLGLIGLGKIALEMIPRAKSFGLQVIAWSRSLTPEKAEALGVEFAADPVELAGKSDIISIHVALTDETKNLIDENVLSALPDGAKIVNTSRGGIIDEEALEKAIVGKKLCVALDVFNNEPSSATGEFQPGIFTLENVQGTHHIGASTEQAQNAVANEIVNIISSYKNLGLVPNCVNLCAKTPASCLLIVRHRDEVGVLAGILDELRQAMINVQEMENIVFSGAKAACAKIQLDKKPENTLLEKIKDSSEHILAISLTELEH